MTTEAQNVETARSYLVALGSGVEGEELAAFFDPDVVQEEFSNRLVPSGARRDLAAMLEGRRRGLTVLSSERYEIDSAIASGTG